MFMMHDLLRTFHFRFILCPLLSSRVVLLIFFQLNLTILSLSNVIVAGLFFLRSCLPSFYDIILIYFIFCVRRDPRASNNVRFTALNEYMMATLKCCCWFYVKILSTPTVSLDANADGCAHSFYGFWHSEHFFRFSRTTQRLYRGVTRSTNEITQRNPHSANAIILSFFILNVRPYLLCIVLNGWEKGSFLFPMRTEATIHV